MVLFLSNNIIYSYLLLNIFLNNDVLLFIVVILLSCMDFWVVKNITGRILVGLRWWNRINDKGENEWVYEGAKEKIEPNTDYRVFWYSMYIFGLIWAVLLFLKIISFNIFYANLCLISFILIATNLNGYWNCDKEQKGQMMKYGQGMIVSIVANKLI